MPVVVLVVVVLLGWGVGLLAETTADAVTWGLLLEIGAKTCCCT